MLNNKDSITVVLSGPSSANVTFDNKTLYFVTNNSYRVVSGAKLLYFLYDPYFVYRYLKLNYYIKKSIVLLFYPSTSHRNIKEWNNKIIDKASSIFAKSKNSNSEFIISPHHSVDYSSIHEYFLRNLKWDGEFYNSGIILIMLAAFFAKTKQIPLNIYGLDMGVGGMKHIDSKNNIVHPKFLSDKNLKGIASLLKNISNDLYSLYNNHSYFNPVILKYN
jgi:hypothetical protein